MNTTEYKEELERKWKEYQETKKDTYYPNIMLVGASGAGKSSLINTVFNGNIAAVSDVRPETQGYFILYKGADYGRSVNLIDTAGYIINLLLIIVYKISKRNATNQTQRGYMLSQY